MPNRPERKRVPDEPGGAGPDAEPAGGESPSPAQRLLADYDTALAAAKTGFWEHDVLTDQTRVHGVILGLLGFDEKDLPASFAAWKRFSMHPEDLASWQDAYLGFVEGRTATYEHTHRRRHKDGSYRWLHSRGHAERDVQGRAVRVFGVATDITELKQARDSLLHREELVRQIAEYSSDVYWLIDVRTRKVLYVSPAFEHIWGFPASQLLDGSRRWVHSVLPEDRATLKAMDLGNRRENWDVTYRVTHTDGSLRWVKARGFPILQEGSPYHVACVMTDVTREREEDARRLDTLRREGAVLLREVHHRIKNGLQGVTGLLAIRMREHPDLAPTLAEAMTQIESVALVHGLQGTLGDGKIGVVALTEAIVRTAAGLARPGLHVDLQVAGDGQVNLARETSLPVALVLNELLTNALKHSRAGDVQGVQVQLRVTRDRVEWQVHNTGTLPPRFDLGRGLGLGTGLSLARAMLPGHGARLHLSDTGGVVTAVLELAPPVILVNEENQ